MNSLTFIKWYLKEIIKGIINPFGKKEHLKLRYFLVVTFLLSAYYSFRLNSVFLTIVCILSALILYSLLPEYESGQWIGEERKKIYETIGMRRYKCPYCKKRFIMKE